MYLSIFYLVFLSKCHVYIVIFIKIKLYSKNKDNNFLKNGFGEGVKGIQNIINVFLKYENSS